MTKNNFNQTQLENGFSQKIKNLYLNYLNHQLNEVSFQWFHNKLVIVIEGTVTRPEQVLYDNNYPELASQTRAIINQKILPQVKNLIEEDMGITIVDFLCDTTINTGRTGIISVFEFSN